MTPDSQPGLRDLARPRRAASLCAKGRSRRVESAVGIWLKSDGITRSDREARGERAPTRLGAAIRGEPSNVVDAHIRLFCRVGGVAKAPVTAVVQPVIKRERQGQGGRSGPHAGSCTAHVERLNCWRRAMRASVVR
jgi:hypothetical protein